MTQELVPVDEVFPVSIIAPAADLAQRIAKTEFVPNSLRNRPEAVLASMLAGHEIGVGPMQSLAKIHIVEGRPALAAELMRALVVSRGHEIWPEEYTSSRVTLCGRRSNTENVSKVTWTLDDAKRAGLAGKQNWQKYPRAMLLARATGELCRLMFADILGGISYTPEEIEDGDLLAPEPDAPSQVTHTRAIAPKAAPKKRATKEKPPKEAPPEPELVDDAATPPPDPKVIQRIVLMAKELDVDRALVNAYVTGGRSESTKDLDAEEAGEAIQILQGIKDGRTVLEVVDGEIKVYAREFSDDEIKQAFAPDLEEPALPGEEEDDVVEGEIVGEDDDSELEPEAVAPPASNREEAWTPDDWRTFLKERQVKVTELLREAHRLTQAKNLGKSPATLDELAGMAELTADLRGFVEDTSLERGQ